MHIVHAGSPVSGSYRVLAAVLTALFLGVIAMDPAMALDDWPVLLLSLLLVIPTFGFTAIVGREPPAILCDPVSLVLWLRGRHPERATDEDLAALRRLGQPAGLFTTHAEARRLILTAEGRLPPTLEQQREIARFRPAKAPMTRASARRFLDERAREEYEARVDAWSEAWLEAGVEIEWAYALTDRERAEFDEASAEVLRTGIPYPLPAHITAWDVPVEAARMRLAGELLREINETQLHFFRQGITRRPLAEDEVRGFLPPVVETLRRAGGVEWELALHYVIARDRPALLTEPWTARESVAEFEGWLRQGE